MKRVRAFKKGKGKARTSIEMDGTLYLECYHLGGQMPNNLNNFTLTQSIIETLWENTFLRMSKVQNPEFVN